jgi:methionyl-tRNA synthetase
MASFQQYVDARNDVTFDEFWDADSDAEVHHFIGKDIVNFHALFWPAVLEASGHRKPTRIHAHGFISVDGAKMSKSRGTFINASTYLDHLDPEYLRYYYATKIRASIDDMVINLDDFVQRVNSDLVGKVVNIASRCAGFINRLHDGELSPIIHDQALWDEFVTAADSIARLYESDEFGKAVREITALADRANQYIADQAPWTLAKQDGTEAEVQQICSLGLNLFKVLVVYLAPILPAMAGKTCAFLNVDALTWEDAQRPLGAHRINAFEPLLTRIDPKDVAAMVDASREVEPSSEQEGPEPTTDREGSASAGNQIEIEDFAKVDLRVARIVAADHVEGADRLLRLTLDLGGEQRQVLAGIRSAYTPESLVGRHTVVVANLKPRKMKFGISEGMVLAAGPGGEDIFLLSPDEGATAGMEVR